MWMRSIVADGMMKKKQKKKRPFKGVLYIAGYVLTQRFVVILLLLAQIFLICYMFAALKQNSGKMAIIFQAMASVTAVYVLNTRSKAEFKIGWLVPLVAFPVFTVAIYFYLNNQYAARYTRKLYAQKTADTSEFLRQNKRVLAELKSRDEQTFRYACYMKDFAGYPTQRNSSVTYFSCGEDKFPVLKDELRKAKHYIFIEMFIIDRGSMWDEIFEILKQKAAEGVDVRLIYDGMGSQNILPFGYHKKLTELGIKTRVFQPFLPLLSSVQNNRDHRKIVVIDGHTGFTGGDNFADEYVNRIVRFGYWKDTSVMIKGDAVWNLTMMFLQMWEVIGREGRSEYKKYLPRHYRTEKYISDGFVIAYGDSPMDDEDVGEISYINILNTAVDYCYISTPYLILNEELISALTFAAKRGVDVRIIVPGIPDKPYVKIMGESFFGELMRKGVKIYEFDGFNHAKMFVSDDCKAIVGTINLDYRSLYLHFENGCFLFDMPAVKDIRADFEDMFVNHCREVTPEDLNNRPRIRRFTAAMLKILEPML